jgi:hypothetical protein
MPDVPPSSSRDEPATAVADVNKEIVDAARVQYLHDAIPALVATSGRERDFVAAVAPADRRLHLHPQKLRTEIGDQVVVGAVTVRNRYERALRHQPRKR